MSEGGENIGRDQLARIAMRVWLLEPRVTGFQERPGGIVIDVTIPYTSDRLTAIQEVATLLKHGDVLARALLAPETEARAMERAVRIIGEIVHGQKALNDSEIEVQVLRIFGRAE